MTRPHFVTVHGQHLALEPLLAQAHPSVTRQALANRLAKGWALDRALMTPVRPMPRHRNFAQAVEAYLAQEQTTEETEL